MAITWVKLNQLASTVKNWRILLEKSFTACMFADGIQCISIRQLIY